MSLKTPWKRAVPAAADAQRRGPNGVVLRMPSILQLVAQAWRDFLAPRRAGAALLLPRIAGIAFPVPYSRSRFYSIVIVQRSPVALAEAWSSA